VELHDITELIYPIVLLLSPIIESFVIHAFVRNKLGPLIHPQRLYLPVIIINVVTLIATQFLWYYLSIWLESNAIAYSAEALPIIAEFCLFRWLFSRMYRQEIFSEPVSSRLILVAVVTANAVTLGLGFLTALY